MTNLISILADTNISGEWLTAFVVAIIGAVGGVVAAWKRGVKEGESKKITLGEPMPEVPVKRVYSPPSYYQHMDLARRVEKVEEITLDLRNNFHKAVEEIRRDSAKQYVEILNAGHERETRIGEKLDDIARAFHSRVDDLLKYQPNKTSR